MKLMKLTRMRGRTKLKQRITLPKNINKTKYAFYLVPLLGFVLMYIYIANKNEDKMKGLFITSIYAALSILISAILIALLFIVFPNIHNVESLNATNLLIYLLILHLANVFTLELLIEK